eukprot:CAMPEP_0196572138 /NCGR_PEP_ID=MMETSP1081-20130531/2234_1 /TAXON_ID=36882 /ORGANISM="Pyramimonas amylifera, Strain CCMP720" /LENGTH=912 /DNA_ID=CAMNT_0041889345 /DNA_START=169 /DNA_END=2907 /DNA_ORIENTATION=-
MNIIGSTQNGGGEKEFSGDEGGGSQNPSSDGGGLWFANSDMLKSHSKIEEIILEAQQKVHFQRQEAHQLLSEANEAEQNRKKLAAQRKFALTLLKEKEQSKIERRGLKLRLLELFSWLKEKQLELSHLKEAEEMMKVTRPIMMAKRKRFKEWMRLLEKRSKVEASELNEVHLRTAKALVNWQETEINSMDVSQREALRKVYRLRAQQLKELQVKESEQLNELHFLKMKYMMGQFNREMEQSELLDQQQIDHFNERNSLFRTHKSEKAALKKQMKLATDVKRREMQNEMNELKAAQLLANHEKRADDLAMLQKGLRRERQGIFEEDAEGQLEDAAATYLGKDGSDSEAGDSLSTLGKTASSTGTRSKMSLSDKISRGSMGSLDSIELGSRLSLKDQEKLDQEESEMLRTMQHAMELRHASHKKVFEEISSMHEEQLQKLLGKQAGEVQMMSRKQEMETSAISMEWEQRAQDQVGMYEQSVLAMKQTHAKEKADMVAGHKREHTLLKKSMDLEKELHTQIVAQNQVVNDVKSEFLSFVCHELRNPLAGVVAVVNMLLGEKLDEDVKDQINTIQHESELMCAIVNDVLDFSKIESNVLVLDPVDFNLHKMMSALQKEHALVAQKTRPQLQVILDIADSVPEVVHADSTRLRQVILNLISNAVKFTFEGFIKMSVSVESQTGKNGWLLRFSVRDTGVGIAAEDLKHIFTAFSQASKSTTREFGGTGLGLGISKALVERLGGTIQVKSERGKGTDFFFTVRMDVVEMKVKVDAVKKEAAPESEMKLPPMLDILVVEDSATLSRLWAKILTNLGCNVDTAGNGQIALDKCALKKYPLVLMDISMPVMSGDKAVAELRKKGWDGVVIALTANAMELDRLKYIEMGMDAVVTKPFQVETLVAKILECFEKRRVLSGRESG